MFLAQAIFSCSSAEYYRFAPTKQEAYKPVKARPAAPVAATITSDETPAPVQTKMALPTTAEPILEASTAPAAPVLAQKSVTVKSPATGPINTKPELTPEENKALALVQNQLANLTKAQKKELKTSVKEVLQENASDSNIVEIIFAILIPPVGVFLHEGITNRFWISLLLTILFFIPGMIYALLVVTDSI